MRTKIKEIITWLESIVWCNSHDKAWIEATIKKLKMEHKTQ